MLTEILEIVPVNHYYYTINATVGTWTLQIVCIKKNTATRRESLSRMSTQ